MNRSILFLLLSIVGCSSVTHQIYTDKSAFLAYASSGGYNVVTETFNSFPSARFPPSSQNGENYRSTIALAGGFVFHGYDSGNYVGVAQGVTANGGTDSPIPNNFLGQPFLVWASIAGGIITLDVDVSPTYAVGFDWFNTDTTDEYRVEIQGISYVVLKIAPSGTTSGFWGVVSDTPITQVSFRNTQSGGYVSDEGIDNLMTIAAGPGVPPPGECSLTNPTTCTDANHGVCVAIGGHNYCDCYSGYKGKTCNTAVGPNYSPLPVKASDVQGGIVLELDVTNTLPNPKLTVSIPSSVRFDNKGGDNPYSTTSFITFGGSNNKCDYPVSNGWDISAPATPANTDIYSASFSWKTLSDCGLAKSTALSTTDYTIFTVPITIERNYVVTNGRFSTQRKLKVQEELLVKFPNKILTRTNVRVANNTVDAYAAVSEVSYSKINGYWTVVLETQVAFPYKLDISNPTADPLTAQGTGRSFALQSGVPASCISVSTGSDKVCTQQFTWKVNLCNDWAFTNLALVFNPVCRSGATTPDDASDCPGPNTNMSPVPVTLSLSTTSACAVTKQYDVGTVTLTSWKDDNFETGTGAARTLFGFSEFAHFTLDYTNPPAQLSSTNGAYIDHVCAYAPTATPPAVCPSANYVSFTTEGARSHKLAFKAKGSDIKTASEVINSNLITVHVDIVLQYDGTFVSKRFSTTHSYGASQGIEISQEDFIKQVEHLENLEPSGSSSLFAGLASLVLVALVL